MMQRSVLRRAAALRSEVPVGHFSHKVVRTPQPTAFFAHPTYVLSREKLLSNMWKEHGVFKYSVHVLVPFGVLATAFKA
jgi:hypothetical protein